MRRTRGARSQGLRSMSKQGTSTPSLLPYFPCTGGRWLLKPETGNWLKPNFQKPPPGPLSAALAWALTSHQDPNRSLSPAFPPHCSLHPRGHAALPSHTCGLSVRHF